MWLWQNQIEAYTGWVNTQLKKKQGGWCIKDLVPDMQDGTAFADLIEVIGEWSFDMTPLACVACVQLMCLL